MYKNLFYIIAVWLLAAGCKSSKPPVPNAAQLVRETGQLVTAEYTLSKIIKANDNKTWYKIGNRKILMSCEALVRAGINLQNVTPKHIQTIGDSVSLLLPPAQFFSLNIPPERIKVQFQEVDALRDPFTAAEREALLAQAEAQIRTTVDSLGILTTAQANATVYLQNLLTNAGFRKVDIRYHPSALSL